MFEKLYWLAGKSDNAFGQVPMADCRIKQTMRVSNDKELVLDRLRRQLELESQESSLRS